MIGSPLDLRERISSFEEAFQARLQPV